MASALTLVASWRGYWSWRLTKIRLPLNGTRWRAPPGFSSTRFGWCRRSGVAGYL